MDTRSACYCWWNSNTKSISSTITAERAEREIRPGEAKHFRKILGLGRRRIYTLCLVCFQCSVSRILVCNSNPLIVFLHIQYVSRSVTVTCNWLLQASSTRLISSFHHLSAWAHLIKTVFISTVDSRQRRHRPLIAKAQAIWQRNLQCNLKSHIMEHIDMAA